MCGIAGVYSFNNIAERFTEQTKNACKQLQQRGPDNTGYYNNSSVSLGHTRLSIIDTSEAGNQPFVSNDQNIIVVFNGEFYNHKEHKNKLINEGFSFRSNSDTEVILNLYIKYGIDVLKYINGCFALAIWDNTKQQLFIARDRLGIKPLYYFQDKQMFCFASEMKALLEYPIPRELNTATLFSYFQLNYIPDHQGMLQNVRKLEPGHFIIINQQGVKKQRFYEIPHQEQQKNQTPLSYEQSKIKTKELLEQAVERRMISDVPLGAFLSGGLDSSIIVALAAQKTQHLNTFSIGFKDQAFFDETRYAETLANKYKTNHTSFRLTNDELFANLFNVLDYIDEPFADSSALAVHILSQHTRKHVTVALSGDGADEMFSGYNKHLAHQKAMNQSAQNQVIKTLLPLWKMFPASRNGNIANKIRQIQRFSTGLNLSAEERYWRWSSLSDEKSISHLIKSKINETSYQQRKAKLINEIKQNPRDMQSVLYSDMQMVLCQDMLMKVDLMSMGNSLEVRTPFLDHHLVDFAFTMPFEYKMKNGVKKRILKDTFKDYLPEDLINRPKHGFEVPLLTWFRGELKDYLDKEIFNRDFLKHQNLFDIDTVLNMKKILNSNNPGDIHARIWAMIVFQSWWKKYLN